MERLIVKEFRHETRTHRDKLAQNHKVRRMIDNIQERSKKLVNSVVPLPSCFLLFLPLLPSLRRPCLPSIVLYP